MITFNYKGKQYQADPKTAAPFKQGGETTGVIVKTPNGWRTFKFDQFGERVVSAWQRAIEANQKEG